MNDINNQPVIFIVEDDKDLNELITFRISELKYKTVSTTYGKDALSKLADFQKALVLLDYKLPDISAEEFVSKIPSPDILFIIMTGYSDVNTAVKFMKLGARDYIVKDSAFLDQLPDIIKKVLNDIPTEKKLMLAENALIEIESSYKSLYENALVGILSIKLSNNTVLSVNGFGLKILGYKNANEINKNRKKWNKIISSETAKKIIYELRDKKEILNKELQIRRKDESLLWCLCSIKILEDKDKIEVIFFDITRRKEAEDRINDLIYYDQLTKLPNKELFNYHVQNEILKAEKRNKNDIFSIIFIGLDKFKNINNVYNPQTGNSLLMQIASRLKNIVFKNDTVSRYDGDKFCILFSDLASKDDIYILINKIQSVFSRNFTAKDIQFSLSATTGVSLYPDDGDTAETLIKNAEIAMDMAKERRIKNHFFDAELNAEVVRNFEIVNELKDAVVNEDFIVHYQPKVNYSGEITGFESLIRWMSKKRGMVPPMEFIPIAEKNGMIVDIENIVLRKSCRQNKKWQDSGSNPVKVAVNISAFHLKQPDFIDDILRELELTGLSPEWLELEFTESGIAENEKDSIAKINKLNKLGISVSIDDFGTGYSSLRRLKEYPIDTLKIDKSFVESIPFDKKSIKIAKAIIDLAHNLGFKVVAEGIEKRDQLDFLENNECDFYQGYYFSKPVPPEKIPENLKKSHTD
ncbi:MAG: EAL domain-containing protein [Spirochaetes bacterium]|nr:EAL domain-containing protein [Spirochaetota bacterium]